MDPLNILVGINILAQFGAHFTGAKQGLRAAVADIKDKPKGFLQTYPPYLSALILVFVILGVFQLAVIEYSAELYSVRVAGLLIYILFSWLQVFSYKALGKNYSQEVVVFKKHELVKSGLYGIVRHPHYLSQILGDLGAALAVMSFIAAPLALIQLPLLVMRGNLEERTLRKYFKEEYDAYKKKTGGFIPFVG